ncbi:MAG: ABC transporter substrate-binding protein, partial [Blastocatellia bacterium]
MNLFLLIACKTAVEMPFTVNDLNQSEWPEIERKARNTTVNFAMWSGDENRNRFFKTEVAEKLKERYSVTLNVVPLGDTVDAINKLLTEKQAGKTTAGSIDVLWINGENFRTAKQGDLLWGSFSGRLPSFGLYEADAGITDFGTPVEGLEAPWQRSQFVFAYDSGRLSDTPRSIENLKEWIRANPGKFTYPAPPDFTGSAFLRHILFHFGGGAKNFGKFDEQLYVSASSKTFEFLNEIKPYMWRRGENYPNSPSELNRLFANREIEFTFAYGAAFASEAINRGEFPASVRTFVLDEGTIKNYSFLTIPFNSSNPAGSLVVINYLMSHEFQLRQSVVLGSIYPHDLSKLT